MIGDELLNELFDAITVCSSVSVGILQNLEPKLYVGRSMWV